ncbi:MAG: type II secretion system F family protein [Candidatus Pacebacteria bacterium]|nr:type II secretion system F family protein [Candidatus Paceibacterota bacterium]
MFLNKVSSLDKILFAKDLSLMVKSGLPIREAVSVIREQTDSKYFRKVLDDIIKNVNNGQPLSYALSLYPNIFDSLYVNMIKVGEESGCLEENLNYLILQIEKSQSLQGKVKAAMVYPAFILGAVSILGFALIRFVLPEILPVFSSLKIELPLMTRILISFTNFLENYGLYLLIGIVFFVFIITFIVRLRPIKFLIHKITLKVPIFGSIVRNVNLAYFSRTLGLLLKSGMPIVSALEIIQKTSGNLVFQSEIKKLSSETKKGKLLSDYLKSRQNIFPKMTSRIIGVGERTGRLEETLLYLGEFYDIEVDRTTKQLSSIIEPVLLIIIGLTVGVISLGIISPIYEITRGLEV